MNRAEVIGVLERTHRKFSNRRAWIKGNLAMKLQDRRLHLVDPCDEQADRWCLLGAIVSECDDSENLEMQVINALGRHVSHCHRNIPDFNDHRDTGYEEVVSLIETTLNRLKKEEKDEKSC